MMELQRAAERLRFAANHEPAEAGWAKDLNTVLDALLEAQPPETAPTPMLSDEMIRQMIYEATVAESRARADARAMDSSKEMLREIGDGAYCETVRSYLYQAGIMRDATTPDPPAETPTGLAPWTDDDTARLTLLNTITYRTVSEEDQHTTLVSKLLDAQRHARAVAPTPLDDDYYQDFAESVFADPCEGDGKHTERLDIGIIADNAKAWFAAQREPVAAPKKLTVGELHALLNAQDDREIYILPDGTIAPGPSAEEVATLRLKLDAAVTAVQRLGEELEQERHARAAERREAIEECISALGKTLNRSLNEVVFETLTDLLEPRVSPVPPSGGAK